MLLASRHFTILVVFPDAGKVCVPRTFAFFLTDLTASIRLNRNIFSHSPETLYSYIHLMKNVWNHLYSI